MFRSRRKGSRPLLIGLVWSVGAVPTRPALAAHSVEPPAETAPAESEVIVPPEFVTGREAAYPESAQVQRIEGRVLLKLTIDSEGHVQRAQVIEGLGHGLDEAATQAALGFLFRPAQRGDTAVAAVVLHAYEFRLPEPTPAVEAPVPAFSTPAAEPTPAPEPEPPPTQEPDTDAVEVTVQGESAADRRRRSAEAVKVIELDRARRESADMGEVLARTQGVSVRRRGGLGSAARFSLAGLTDEQVRFFLDGIPLELQGYAFGIANVPVNAVDRVEIYSGVVPVRFGADALGGAVNLVTDDDVQGTRGGASYEVGSFGSHRVTLSARRLDRPTGLLGRISGYFDFAKNAYPVDVEVPDARGRLSPAKVVRFHDDYLAQGASAEVALVDQPFAKRLGLRAFVSDHYKEYQHNVVMTVPYGEVSYEERTLGGSLRYQHGLGRGVFLDTVVGHTENRGRFLDVAECVYDWYGRCVRPRRIPGETDSEPHDELYFDDTSFARAQLAWHFLDGHALRLALAPTNTSRTGDERRQFDPDARDSLTAQRDLFTMVNGVEYELDLFNDRVENIAFAKQYLQQLDSEEPRPNDTFRRRDRDTNRFGVGDGVRYRVTNWLYAKASYEFATRLPTPDEIFGDNAFIVANLELQREVSHNGNLGATVEQLETPVGAMHGGATILLREADALIVLLGNDRVQSYQNVYSARSLGAEATLGWTSPGRHLLIDLGATYLDFRNTSARGTFADYEADRIPNRPYLFGNADARVQLPRVLDARDELSLFWNSRYVHEYFRGWESVGLREFKQTIDAQLVHSAGATYRVEGAALASSATAEVQNVTNEAVFDYFGVQRPGRAFFVKGTVDF